jgi:hypothetical protein
MAIGLQWIGTQHIDGGVGKLVRSVAIAGVVLLRRLRQSDPSGPAGCAVQARRRACPDLRPFYVSLFIRDAVDEQAHRGCEPVRPSMGSM